MKKKLVVIHGALGSSVEMRNQVSVSDRKFEVVFLDILGHGKNSDKLDDFTYDNAKKRLAEELEKVGECFIFGFSMGGYLALDLAIENHPSIKGIVTLGTKLAWTLESAKNEVKFLDETLLKTKQEAFYNHLVSLHGDNLPKLLEKTASVMMELGSFPRVTSAKFKNVSIPIRLIRGGKDKMVSKEESLEIVSSNSLAQYFEISHFIHPIAYLNAKHVGVLVETHIDSLGYKWVNTKEGKVAYKKIEIDSSSSPTILFLHEALGSIAQWKDFPEKLCHRLGCNGVVTELIGYGYSDATEIKRNRDYLRFFGKEHIPELVDALQLDSKLLLVGHSDGGTNALFYARYFEEKVFGVVTFAAHCINEAVTRNGIFPAIEAYQNNKLKGLEVFHGAKTEKVFYDWAETWLSEDYKNWDITEEIKGINRPGLIIQGEFDQYGTEKQVSLIADSFDASVEKLLLKCGHAPHLEDETNVLSAIEIWYSRLKQ